MTHILMSRFKESTERQKASFLKETVENAGLHIAVLNKAMTTQEYCVKYDFVAPLKEYHLKVGNIAGESFNGASSWSGQHKGVQSHAK